MSTETTTRKPPPDIVFDSPPCPVCDDGGDLSTNGDSWWCDDCGCTWDIDGTGGEWPDPMDAPQAKRPVVDVVRSL